MKVNLGALGITIGLILVAVSMLAVGLMIGIGLTTLEKRIFDRYRYVKTDITRTIIAEEYAFSKADSEKRAITLEDLREGYALANKFMEEWGG